MWLELLVSSCTYTLCAFGRKCVIVEISCCHAWVNVYYMWMPLMWMFSAFGALLLTCASRSVVDNCTVHTAIILISVLEVQSSCSIHTACSRLQVAIQTCDWLQCTMWMYRTKNFWKTVALLGCEWWQQCHCSSHLSLAGTPPSVLQMLSHESIA